LIFKRLCIEFIIFLKLCKADAILKICEFIRCVSTGAELKFAKQESEETCRMWTDYLYVGK
jgi:hypothetical protein